MSVCGLMQDLPLTVLSSTINAHAHAGHLELEFRLCRLKDKTLSTNVGKTAFDKVLDILQRSDVWEETQIQHSIQRFGQKERITEYDDGSVTVEDKHKLFTDDVRHPSGCIIRVALAEEITRSQEPPDKIRYERHRDRASFRYKSQQGPLWQFDLTVCGQRDDDCDENYEYQIEIELLNLSEVLKDRPDGLAWILQSGMAKMHDVISMIMCT